MNRYLILPLGSSFKSIVPSFDVIHPLGFHSFGIKLDGIPGRIHFASTLRTLLQGEHRGFRVESRGQGHSPMLLLGIVSVHLKRAVTFILFYSLTFFYIVLFLFL